VAKSLKNTP